MRQALHILKKDVRYLWIEILITLAATGLLAFTGMGGPTRDLRRMLGATQLVYLLPLAWWTLIARAVHAETLAGDREFWPTRPYAWQSLLAAKGLLILLFINLPLFLAQAAIVKSHGFSWGASLAGLLWIQVLLTVAFALPVAAVAALTTGMVQLLLAMLTVYAATMLLSMSFMGLAANIAGGDWGPMNWISTYYSLLLIAVAAPAILLWQYAKRRTMPARVMAGVFLVILALGPPISWSTAFAMQSRFSRQPIDNSQFHATVRSGLEWATRALVNRDGSVDLHIPLDVSGIPDGMQPRYEGLTLSIEGPGGAVWKAESNPRGNFSESGQLIALQTTVDSAFYRKVKDQRVRLSGYLYLTLFGNQTVSALPFDSRRRAVPGMGFCSASGGNGAPYFLGCASTFRPPSSLVSVDFESKRPWNGPGPKPFKVYAPISYYAPLGPLSYSPFPAEFSLNPVNPYAAYSTSKDPVDEVTVVSKESLAHVRAALAIDGLRLADYERHLQ